MLPLDPDAGNVQLRYDSDGKTFFVRANGRQQPHTRDEVGNRFGWPFAYAAEENADMWLTLDAAELNRVRTLRERYEIVGLPYKLDFRGLHCYGVLDRLTGELVPKSTSRFECALSLIDCITSEWLDIQAAGLPRLIQRYQYEPPEVRDDHGDSAVTAAGLSVEDQASLNQWIDDHNPQPTDAELDAMFIAYMERLDAEREPSTSARIAWGNIVAMEAVTNLFS